MADTKFTLLKENTVESYLFPHQKNSNLQLDTLSDSINSFVNDLTEIYIWHVDKFAVSKPIRQLNDICDEDISYLYSSTYFGDNIDDEWLIAYILFEVTKQFPDLIVRLTDDDGQFLLIEAADVLPAWANPGTCENRVYIKNGQIHLIPPSVHKLDEKLSIACAVKCVEELTEMTVASSAIQHSVRHRLSGYPNKMYDSFHNATVYLPIKVAALLRLNEKLIAPAVNAFCSRTVFDSKKIRKFDCFKLENFVKVNVKFTKCLYAILTHAKCNYTNNAGWKIPHMNSPDHKSYALGFKLTSGFEILSHEAIDNIEGTKRWNQFLENLKKNDYFENNIQDSKGYNKLLEQAKEFYLANEISKTSSFFGNQVKELLLSPDLIQAMDKARNVHNADDLKDDSDDWLTIQPEELNKMLEKRFGNKIAFNGSSNIDSNTLTKKVVSFLNKESDLDGVEFNQETEAEINEEGTDKVDFDVDQFSNAVKNILDLVIPEDNWDLDSGTDLSEYGSDDDCKSPITEENDVVNLSEYYNKQIEKELSSSTITQSLVKSKNEAVDISENAYINMMRSYKEEMGGAGPTGIILANIGIHKESMKIFDSDDE